MRTVSFKDVVVWVHHCRPVLKTWITRGTAAVTRRVRTVRTVKNHVNTLIVVVEWMKSMCIIDSINK